MILVLVGPTAAGKSRLAVAVARRLAAAGAPSEVVNADSMLVYRGMDIGTAKPTAAERQGVPHHLIDILDVRETATVADFQQRARAVIADCQARGVCPIVVGGSALYIRAIVDDFRFPGTDPDFRARLEADLAGSARGSCTSGWPGRSGGGRPDRPGERAADRPGPGGHRP